MKFFAAGAKPGEDEDFYAALAAFACVPALPMEERIATISWASNGEIWTATVGERLRGTSTRQRQRQGVKRMVTEHLGDPAIVAAIFPGTPYRVVTSAQPLGPTPSRWSNPIMAGEPTRIERFDAP